MVLNNLKMPNHSPSTGFHPLNEINFIPLIFINISKTNYLLINQPSPMHNTRHKTMSHFNTPLFNNLQTHKCYLHQVIPMWTTEDILTAKFALPNLH